MDKQGLVFVGAFEGDIKRYHERFTVIRMMQVAYVLGLNLATRSLNSSENRRLLECLCKDVKFPHRVTNSVRLREIWSHLVREFALDKRCEELLMYRERREPAAASSPIRKKVPHLFIRLIIAAFVVLVVIASIIALLTWAFGEARSIGLLLIVISSVVFVLLAITFILVVADIISEEQAMELFRKITNLLPPFEKVFQVFSSREKHS